MKHRNLVHLFIALCLLFIGLGLVQAQDEPVTLTIWHWGGIDDNNQQDERLAEIYPELFERIQVENLSVGANDAEVYQQFRLALASGDTLPDAVTMNYIALPEFASAGVLEDLTECVAPYMDDVSQAGQALMQYDGETVAIPKQAKSKLWFYRTDMFAEAGIDPTAIATFEDFMAAAEQFHATFPDAYLINLGAQPIHYWYFTMLSHWSESRVATEDGEYLVASDPSFNNLFTWTKALYDAELTFRTDDFSADWNQAFADNHVGSWLSASWGFNWPVNEFSETPNPEQWGVTLWPEFIRAGAEAGGGIVVVPRGAPNAELVCEYLATQFLTTDGSVNYFEGTGVIPVTRSGLDELSARAENPVQPEGMSDEDWARNQLNFWGTDLIDAMAASYDVFQIFPYDPAASTELEILRQHMESLLAGRHETVQDALDAAQADMESQIGNPYEF
ncbi:MAG: extracellular solute-binding protein [Aggregatilineales bacterium]